MSVTCESYERVCLLFLFLLLLSCESERVRYFLSL